MQIRFSTKSFGVDAAEVAARAIENVAGSLVDADMSDIIAGRPGGCMRMWLLPLMWAAAIGQGAACAAAAAATVPNELPVMLLPPMPQAAAKSQLPSSPWLGVAEDEALAALRIISAALGKARLRHLNLSDNALGEKGIRACAAAFSEQVRAAAVGTAPSPACQRCAAHCLPKLVAAQCTARQSLHPLHELRLASAPQPALESIAF